MNQCRSHIVEAIRRRLPPLSEMVAKLPPESRQKVLEDFTERPATRRIKITRQK